MSKALIVYVYDEIEREATGEAGHWWLHESLKTLENSFKKEFKDWFHHEQNGIHW